MGGAGSQTCSVMQSGVGVSTGITVSAARAVTHSAVRVAAQTLPLLLALKEALGTVEHTQALVEVVVPLTACRGEKLSVKSVKPGPPKDRGGEASDNTCLKNWLDTVCKNCNKNGF